VLSGAVTDYDVYLSQVPIPRNKAGEVLFTRPYFRDERGVLVRTGTIVESVVASRALRWGALSGRTAVAFVQKNVKPTTPVMEFPAVAAMATALVNRTIDAAMVDTVTVLRLAKDSGGALEVAGIGEVSERALPGRDLHDVAVTIRCVVALPGAQVVVARAYAVPERRAPPTEMPP
jgi:ABC-type amino acid transport substrate-binding protein